MRRRGTGEEGWWCTLRCWQVIMYIIAGLMGRAAVHPSQHLQLVLMRNDRSHPLSPIHFSHFNTTHCFPCHVPWTLVCTYTFKTLLIRTYPLSWLKLIESVAIGLDDAQGVMWLFTDGFKEVEIDKCCLWCYGCLDMAGGPK